MIPVLTGSGPVLEPPRDNRFRPVPYYIGGTGPEPLGCSEAGTGVRNRCHDVKNRGRQEAHHRRSGLLEAKDFQTEGKHNHENGKRAPSLLTAIHFRTRKNDMNLSGGTCNW